MSFQCPTLVVTILLASLLVGYLGWLAGVMAILLPLDHFFDLFGVSFLVSLEDFLWLSSTLFFDLSVVLETHTKRN